MGNVILWLNQNPAVSGSILVILIVLFVLLLAREVKEFHKINRADFERKRIYKGGQRGK